MTHWENFQQLSEGLKYYKQSSEGTTLLKESLSQVLSCAFCENLKNTFFTEHLRTTASKILCFISCSSSCTVTMRLDLLLHLLCEETLPHHAVAFSILTGVLHTARKNACSKVCKSVITTFAVMIFLCEREAA